MPTDAIFINGTVGSGKSSVAAAVGALEAIAGRPHAVIDLDDIRRLWPTPIGDPFHHELELINLSDLVRNYRSAGAERLVLAGVIETATEIPRYQQVLGSTGLFLCRLTVEPAIGAARLRHRHEGDPDGRDWSLKRMAELAGILADADIDHLVLDTSRRTPTELADNLRCAAGWAR